MIEHTAPLENGAKLPDHPATTTGRRIIRYGKVYDAQDSQPLTQGLPGAEVQLLMGHNPIALTHLYRYVIRNQHIYHTREKVIISVETVDV